jgi:hypothetical protein
MISACSRSRRSRCGQRADGASPGGKKRMTLYELVFILLFLGSVISLLLSAFLRRRGASRNILVALASV